MDIYTSSQETSRCELPQHHVEANKISDSQPSNKARSLPRQVRQVLKFGQVDTRFQFRCVSNEPGTDVPTKIFMFYSTQQDSPHVWKDRHGVLVLFASKELGTSVWAKVKANKIFIFYLTMPTQHNKPQNSQQEVGKVPSPVVYLSTTTSRRWGTVNNNMTTVLQENNSDNRNTGGWNQC